MRLSGWPSTSKNSPTRQASALTGRRWSSKPSTGVRAQARQQAAPASPPAGLAQPDADISDIKPCPTEREHRAHHPLAVGSYLVKHQDVILHDRRKPTCLRIGNKPASNIAMLYLSQRAVRHHIPTHTKSAASHASIDLLIITFLTPHHTTVHTYTPQNLTSITQTPSQHKPTTKTTITQPNKQKNHTPTTNKQQPPQS